MFSEAVKYEVKQVTGVNCFACDTASVQIAHVTSKEDTPVSAAIDRHLANLTIEIDTSAV